MENNQSIVNDTTILPLLGGGGAYLCAIIVAGGKGERMNAALPKQFLPLAGKPVLMHTLQAFADYDQAMELILVLPETQIEFWKELCKEYAFDLPHQIVAGGNERFYSVRNGLAAVAKRSRSAVAERSRSAVAERSRSVVAVHDGVRPLVSRDTIARCFDEAARSGAAIPVLEPTDSIRQTDGTHSQAVNRRLFRLVQTPQVFDAHLLKKAYEQPYTPQFTDDASVVEAFGATISLVEGNRENLKITAPMDLIVAESLIKQANR